MSNTGKYLERLPPHSRRRGSAAKGEAEIVTSRRELDRISAECASALKGSALGRIYHLDPREMATALLRGKTRDSYTLGALMLAQLKGLMPDVRVTTTTT